jgi:hypothetical protein
MQTLRYCGTVSKFVSEEIKVLHKITKKVKLSLYRPGQALGVPGG